MASQVYFKNIKKELIKELKSCTYCLDIAVAWRAYIDNPEDSERVNEIKFDYGLVKESLRFYKPKDIPKIETVNIPKVVYNVRFMSNLMNSN